MSFSFDTHGAGRTFPWTFDMLEKAYVTEGEATLTADDEAAHGPPVRARMANPGPAMAARVTSSNHTDTAFRSPLATTGTDCAR